MSSAPAILVSMGKTTKSEARKSVLVAIPPDIKRAAAKRVEEGLSSNMNDEIVGVLAARYGVAFDPTGRKGVASSTENGGKTLLRMPPKLKTKIAKEALRDESNLHDVIFAQLALEYGVGFEPRRARTVPFGGGR